MKYAFILGRNPELSIAELGAIFQEKLQWKIGTNVAFFDGNLPQSPQDFLNRLGGTTEILEIFEENTQAASLETAVTHFLKNRHSEGKLVFSLNLLPENKKSSLLKFLLPKIKKNLRADGISNNFLNKNFSNVSAVAAKKQGSANVWIIDKGESCMALDFSVAMQDFEAYSKRDYGKPFRDAGVGMLPPKLAQIMINLANVIPAKAGICTIFDPFCGTGTILMEALLMGYDVIGSDKNARLVEGAQKNIDWLRQIFPSRVRANTHAELFIKDATTLNNVIARPEWPKQSHRKNEGGSLSIGLATEPYLGPPLTQFPAQNFLDHLMQELEKLYLDFFKNLARWLPKSTPVVFIFPYWKGHAGRRVRLSERLIAKVEALGYSKSAFVPLQTTSLLYDRPDSVVGREIVRFIKI